MPTFLHDDHPFSTRKAQEDEDRRTCGTMQKEQKLPQPRMMDRYAETAPSGRSGVISALPRTPSVSASLCEGA